MKSISIMNAMKYVALSALLAMLYRDFGIISVVSAIFSLALGVGVRYLISFYTPVSPWILIATLLIEALHTIAIVYIYDDFIFIIANLTLPILAALTFGSGFVWVSEYVRYNSLVKRCMRFIIIGLGVGQLYMAFSPWPLYIAFAISRKSMDSISFQMSSGAHLQFPQRAGVYTILGAEVDSSNGNVALFTNIDRFSRSGFVKIVSPLDPFKPMSALNTNVTIDTFWRYQSED